LSTTHLYVRANLIREAAAELAIGDGTKVEIVPRLGEHDCMIEHSAQTACELIRERLAGEWFADSLARMLAVQLGWLVLWAKVLCQPRIAVVCQTT